MPFARQRIAVEQAVSVGLIVEQNDKMRNANAAANQNGAFPESVDDTYWKTYDYCAAVVRLYAGFERFVYEVTEDWLRFLTQVDRARLFASPDASERYRLGAAEILRRFAETRFSSVDLRGLTATLQEFVNASSAVATVPVIAEAENKADSKPILITSDGFFSKLPNLKLADIVSLLKSVEIDSPSEWIDSFPPLAAFSEDTSKTTEAYLKELVERRNEAAHGNALPVDTLGTQPLKDIAQFVQLLSQAICELVADRKANYGLVTKVAQAKIGVVTYTYTNAKAAIVTCCDTPIWQGMKIFVKEKHRCYLTEIASIALESDPMLAVGPNPGSQVGLKFSGPLPKAGATLWRIGSVAALAHWSD